MSQRNIAVTLECFIKKGDKYLMLHRNPDKRIMPGVWMAPGGHMEEGEGLFECARREALEETGLRIKNLKIRAVGNARLQDLGEEIHFHFIFADYDGGELKQNDKDGELQWLNEEEILKLDNLLAESKMVLPILFKDENTVVSYKAVYKNGNNMVECQIEKS